MSVDLKIMFFLSFVIFASPYIAKTLKLSISACEMMLGMVGAFFLIIEKSPNFQYLSQAGFYYLMFIAGLEVDIKDFFKIDKRTYKKIFWYFLMLYTFSFFICFYFEYHYVFIAIFTVMSVGVLSTLFKEFGKDVKWLNLSFLVATIGEIISIVLLSISSSLSSMDTSLIHAVKDILYFCIFITLFTFYYKFFDILFWWYPKLQKILMPDDDKAEKDVRLCLAYFILIIALMIYFHLEVAFGVFLIGTFVKAFFIKKHELEEKLMSIGYGFLIPCFFVYIGSTFDLHLLFDVRLLKFAISLCLIMVLLRVFCSFIFARTIGGLNCILFGLSQSMPLTLCIAFATLSLNAKLIDNIEYSAMILGALLEAIVCIGLINIISRLGFLNRS